MHIRTCCSAWSHMIYHSVIFKRGNNVSYFCIVVTKNWSKGITFRTDTFRSRNKHLNVLYSPLSGTFFFLSYSQDRTILPRENIDIFLSPLCKFLTFLSLFFNNAFPPIRIGQIFQSLASERNDLFYGNEWPYTFDREEDLLYSTTKILSFSTTTRISRFPFSFVLNPANCVKVAAILLRYLWTTNKFTRNTREKIMDIKIFPTFNFFVLYFYSLFIFFSLFCNYVFIIFS